MGKYKLINSHFALRPVATDDEGAMSWRTIRRGRISD